jgi:hypothetical protein
MSATTGTVADVNASLPLPHLVVAVTITIPHVSPSDTQTRNRRVVHQV